MSIETADIKKMAWLARIAIAEEDIPDYLHDISNMIDLIAEMNSANTEDIEPLEHPINTTTLLRPDKITETDQRDLLQKIAPTVDRGYYLVPKVIKS